jgi:hypothetical protein
MSLSQFEPPREGLNPSWACHDHGESTTGAGAPRTDERLAALPSDAFRMLVSQHTWVRAAFPNILLTGSEPDIDAIVQYLAPEFQGPVLPCQEGDPPSLSLPPMPFTGTLLVRHLDALAPAEQQRLQQWLTDAQGRAQIVSASTSALWADVERGAFHEALYYRLNVVSVDVRRGPGSSGRVTPDA